MYPGLPTNESWDRRQTTAAAAAVRPSNHVAPSPTSASADKTPAFAHSAALDAAIAGLASTSDMLIPRANAGGGTTTTTHANYGPDHHYDAAAGTRAAGATKPPSRRGSLFQIQVTRTSLETSSSHAASRSMHSSVAGGIDGSLYVPAATTGGLIRPRAGQLLHRKSPRRLIHPVPESEPNDVDSILATARAGVVPGLGDAEAAAEDEDISVDPTKLDPYLQALAVVQFQPWIFFRELVVHWTPGAVLLTLFTRAGRIRARNRAFFDWSLHCFMQWTFFAAFLVPMVLYSSGLAANWNIQMEEHINFCLIWLFRNAVVATKHAYTSPIEQAQMDEELESHDQRIDRQVLTAWHNPPSSVVELQILLASVRQSIDLTSGHFLLAPDDDDDHYPAARPVCTAIPASPHPAPPSSPGLPDTPAPADPTAPALIYDLRVRYGAYLDKTTYSTAATEAGSLAPGACPLVSNAMGSPPPAPPDVAGPDDRNDATAPHLPPTFPIFRPQDGAPAAPFHSPTGTGGLPAADGRSGQVAETRVHVERDQRPRAREPRRAHREAAGLLCRRVHLHDAAAACAVLLQFAGHGRDRLGSDSLHGVLNVDHVHGDVKQLRVYCDLHCRLSPPRVPVPAPQRDSLGRVCSAIRTDTPVFSVAVPRTRAGEPNARIPNDRRCARRAAYRSQRKDCARRRRCTSTASLSTPGERRKGRPDPAGHEPVAQPAHVVVHAADLTRLRPPVPHPAIVVLRLLYPLRPDRGRVGRRQHARRHDHRSCRHRHGRLQPTHALVCARQRALPRDARQRYARRACVYVD
ncbi:hypothetical protein AMAG_01004 [Allomyces macrogynus ATCC 38327]|uniref:Uncharacterized protein n=1 Tax=Allomyces macrogynus (strain ATCC 38327) TaxID=578462 RepID=A0A0L0RXL1_ALLM3|nr:hypothetical protein AMAG_01004 [Allomyces macrogynus ATCC 38327]|eukprot:KNE55068.1 hypothetical protein AMAG_01004 [Allomyces macrogynus ATCC 38327]